MVVEIVLFSVAFVSMGIILIHKHMEGSRGAYTLVHDIRGKVDPILHTVRNTTARIASYFTLKNAVLLANFLFVHIVRFLMHISHAVHRMSSHVVTKASQKKEDLTRGGAASFYLKQIKEDKAEGGSGKIDDTMMTL